MNAIGNGAPFTGDSLPRPTTAPPTSTSTLPAIASANSGGSDKFNSMSTAIGNEDLENSDPLAIRLEGDALSAAKIDRDAF